jgi:hypothetical protein
MTRRFGGRWPRVAATHLTRVVLALIGIAATGGGDFPIFR